ncbi:hypothetical protein [Clostridium perfringens]
MYKHSDLDKRICDIEKGATNTETLREFIKRSEKEFGLEPSEKFELEPVDLDSMIEEDLNNYIDYLDRLWEK